MDAARPATTEDVDELARLRSVAHETLRSGKGGDLWWRRDLRHGPDPAALAAAVADERTLVLVGTIDEVIVAYALARLEILTDGGTLAVIDELYVEPEGREVGVGETLVAHLVSWAEQSGAIGIDAFALPGDRAVKNLFERSGLVARAILVHRRLGGGTST